MPFASMPKSILVQNVYEEAVGCYEMRWRRELRNENRFAQQLDASKCRENKNRRETMGKTVLQQLDAMVMQEDGSTERRCCSGWMLF